MSSNANTLTAPTPEMASVIAVATSFIPKEYSNGVKHMYQLNEHGKKVHVSRQSMPNDIEETMALVYGVDKNSAADALLADYGYAAVNPAVTPNTVTAPNTAPATPAARAIGTAAVQRKGWFNRATSYIKEKPRRALAVAALGLAALGIGNANLRSDNASATNALPRIEADTSSTTTSSTTSTTEKATTTTTTPEQLQAKYGNVVTGDRNVDQIGLINIDPSNPEASKQEFYNELRHNPDALAFWNTCLSTNTPSYDVCVGDPNLLLKADEQAVQFRNGDLAQKATTAEMVIAQFEKAHDDGISIEDGEYQTIGINKDGKFYAATNVRFKDARLNFTFTFNGKKFPVQVRACDQLTKNKVPTPTPTTPVTVPPQETTTTTTTPQETTTTTTPQETTTTTTVTVPKSTTTTTSTTAPSTTTSSTSTTTSTTAPTTSTSTSTTSTSTTTSTTTPVTMPKSQTSTTLQGEIRTTNTLDPLTSVPATTSTVPTTEGPPTTPRDGETTTAPVPAQEPTPNPDFVIPPFWIPLVGGSTAFVSFGEYRKKRANKR